ncbi:MAG TPA: hypothetical protein VG345_06505 [Bryobacteraceae bacterium]|nr:hypothetical protein [Bryobacteraceae bacterium]
MSLNHRGVGAAISENVATKEVTPHTQTVATVKIACIFAATVSCQWDE